MGCAFEANREQPTHTIKQPKRTNQCGPTTATTIKTAEYCNCKRNDIFKKKQKKQQQQLEKKFENINIKDNYQQNHKTQRTQTTQLKAPAQVLSTSQQQQQKQQQQEQQSIEVAHKDERQQAFRTHEIATIDTTTTPFPTTLTPNALQIVGANCYTNSNTNTYTKPNPSPNSNLNYTKIRPTTCNACCPTHEQRQRWLRRRCQQQQQQQHHAATAAVASLAAACIGGSFTSLQEMLLHARAALATQLGHVSQALGDNVIDYRETTKQQRQVSATSSSPTLAATTTFTSATLSYQPWQQLLATHNANAATATAAAAAAAAVPATMSAAILANVGATAAATSAAAYQYVGQHYKFYSQSFSFYAAYSVILMLCYLTTTSTAAATSSETGALDKHPIHGIDWSKFDESSSDKEILDLLLEKKRYDKRLLPPVNGTLTVNVNVLLLSLASPDESSLKYEVEFLLNQQWNDPRLQYGNKSHYDFLNALHHHDSIWTPDTYFIMHGDFKDPIIPMHFALRIFRNGTITYAMRRHLILSCQGSLHIFPFDDPKCSFSMESISYEEAQIKYVWKNDEDTLRKSPSLTTLNAYLIKNQTTACDQNSWRGNYSCLRVDLIFTRDRAFYFTTVFIPGIILVTSSFITFWLEWNAVPARSMIGVTTMLNFFTTSNGFRSTLPVVSNLTAMNVWDGVCMCFIYASLLEFVCVNYVGRKRPLHNVVYRPGENPVTQASAGPTPAMATPLSAGTAASSVSPGTPRHHTTELSGMRWQEEHGGIIGAAVQNLRARSIKRKNVATSAVAGVKPSAEHVYAEPTELMPTETATRVKFKDEQELNESQLMLRRSVATSTPALVVRIERESQEVTQPQQTQDMEMSERQLLPMKPPRRKSSRSTSPASVYAECGIMDETEPQEQQQSAGAIIETQQVEIGEKRRDAGAPNEIVACTTCGGSNSPCTHSANNGCATETCFVQVRKKEPPHPIRVAKTIDVIARITFPTAYAIFLIFFFVHYKGFS